MNDIANEQAAKVLEYMQVGDPFPNCYYIGKGASRVTFQSQQIRALNLVWALKEADLLGKGKRVAVIGGGLAGLTAALAARWCDATVRLFEERPDLMHLQRGCHLRYIHPNILDWPDPKAQVPFTSLPILNWGCGSAAFVSELIIGQWSKLCGEIKDFRNCQVQRIKYDKKEQKPIVSISDPEHGSQTYDIVLAATGFGMERKMERVPFLSYWHNDRFSQPVIDVRTPQRYLVSGCGDGGLVDVIRLRLLDFDHRRFSEMLVNLQVTEKLRTELLEIDREAVLLTKSKFSPALQSSGGNAKEAKSIVKSEIAEFIWRRYTGLNIPPELEQYVRDKKRVDTEVFLNANAKHPYSLDSAIINRFAYLLVEKYAGVKFIQGKLEKVTREAGKYCATVRYANHHKGVQKFDEVILRHGPERNLAALFNETVAESIVNAEVEPEEMQTRFFTPGFLNDAFLDREKEQIRSRHAVANFSGLISTLEIEASEVAVKFHPLSYVIRGDQRHARQQFLGVNIEYTHPVPGVIGGGLRVTSAPTSHGPFKVGDFLEFRTEKGIGKRQVGCVLWSRQRELILFANARGIRPSLLILDADQNIVAEVAFVRQATASPFDSSITSGSIIKCFADDFTAEARPGAVFSKSLPLASASRIKGLCRADKGAEVIAVRMNEQLVAGKVVSVGALEKDVREEGACWFANCLLVEFPADQFPTEHYGAVYSPDGFLAGLIVGQNKNIAIVLPGQEAIGVHKIALECDLEWAKNEILVRALSLDVQVEINGVIHYGGDGPAREEFVCIGNRTYDVSPRASATLQEGIRVLAERGLLKPSGNQEWVLTHSGYEEAERARESHT